MIHRFVLLGSLLALLAGSLWLPVAALAADPIHGATPSVAVPPLRTDGPVVLPDGRVLPVEPASLPDSSIQAEMLEAHDDDRIGFAPGARPEPRDAPSATLSLASRGIGSITPLGLAPASGSTATLAVAGTLPNGLRKEVLGFLPYWLLDAGSLQWMQYQLVSTIAYFGVAARSDGSLETTSTGWSGWNSSAMTGVINAAHARGVRVVLTVTMMAWDGGAGQAALLGNATARTLLVNGIVAAVRDRAADGINLDFEPVATPQRDQYTSFVRQVKAALVAAGVGSYLTVDTTAGAATWATGYDLAGLTATGAADAVFVMGYDYSWSGSARAGGVAPMDSPYILDVRESVDDYLSVIPGSKIIWGVPYYGRTWQTTNELLNAPTRTGASGASKAYTYISARNLAAGIGRQWDDVGKVPWFAYYDSANATWVQGYYDDPASLTYKYDLVNARGLAGAGMWTLLMDQGDSALWNLLAAKFVNDTTPPTGGIRILPQQADASAVLVEWAATDVGSGVASYSLQVRDRASGSWNAWLTGTAETSATFVGDIAHAYEFRVSATDTRGNQQPWLPSAADPGASPTAGGFARVLTDTLNVRSGAGTGFSVIDTLGRDAPLAVLGGPIDSGGYRWYQVQFDFAEWPSSDYPRVGWVASGTGTTTYIAPSAAPNVTVLGPTWAGATGYNPPVALTFRAGSHTGYKFDSNGVATGVKGYTLATDSSANTSTRASVPNRSGSWFYVTNGIWAGYWLPQSSSLDLASAAPSYPGATTFNPPVALTFKAGSHTGYKFDVNGVATGVKGYTLATDSSASTSSRTAIPNRPGFWFYVTNGIWAGYWLPESSSLYLASNPPPAPTDTITYNPPVALTFKAGSHTGYTFSSTGVVTGVKGYTLATDSSASTSSRSTIPNQAGHWFYVTNGIWAGYWLPESSSLYLAPAAPADVTFSPPRTVLFSAGTYTGYTFDSNGVVTGLKGYTLVTASSASADRRASINGVPYFHIVNGIWAGYWIAESSSTVLG